jgi:hypothetical protein
VLLLYAAAVHQLGLAAVKAAIPDWHSVEVGGGVLGVTCAVPLLVCPPELAVACIFTV